ncbi:MAG: sulfite exporter TauE/SafE family protein [Clostridiales bacterium]|nr:sulfite exporter TauE/SafE family protein [Clostridiales bacterium]MCF8023465.1 sulfite exporter TauE/SafE family protein [Clostridiales bacterium]
MHALPTFSGEAYILLICIGALVGSIVGTFGFVGGFLTTPLLVLTGFPAVVAVTSTINKNFSGSLLSVLVRNRASKVDFKLLGIFAAGSFAGCIISIEICHYLLNAGIFDLFIKYSYTIFLTIIGILILFLTLNTRAVNDGKSAKGSYLPVIQNYFKQLPGQLYFAGDSFKSSFFLIIMLGFLVGMLAGLYGIGGSLLIFPAMLYLLEVPVPVAADNSLLLVLITSSAVLTGHVLINHSSSFFPGLLIFIGWIAGMQLSTVLVRCLSPFALRVILSLSMLCTVLLMQFNYLV